MAKGKKNLIGNFKQGWKTIFLTEYLCVWLLMFTVFLIFGCSVSKSRDQNPGVILYGTNSIMPFPVKKDTFFRVANLRAGAIKTEKDWDIQDFAHSLFNPDSGEITINLKMVSNDSDFVFANHQKGTFTKIYKLKPFSGTTDNVYIAPAFEKYNPNWPILANTNFSGSVEFSSSKPFYYYLLHETPVGEAKDIMEAYHKAWNPCEYNEEGVWDDSLHQFVVPYTNYWHNTIDWVVGWYSILVIKNNTDKPVTYTMRHIPFYGGQFNSEKGWITHFKEQVVDVTLQKHEEKRMPLMKLYRWPTNEATSMEGCLFILPDRKDALRSGTTIRLMIVPNKSGKPLHNAIP